MSKDADNKKTSGVSYILSSLGFQFAVGPKHITLSKKNTLLMIICYLG